MTYTVTFTRIGRSHDVAPLTVSAENANHLAKEIWLYARPHLRSRDVDVVVDLEDGTGHILAGFNNGGTFTVKES